MANYRYTGIAICLTVAAFQPSPRPVAAQEPERFKWHWAEETPAAEPLKQAPAATSPRQTAPPQAKKETPAVDEDLLSENQKLRQKNESMVQFYKEIQLMNHSLLKRVEGMESKLDETQEKPDLPIITKSDRTPRRSVPASTPPARQEYRAPQTPPQRSHKPQRSYGKTATRISDLVDRMEQEKQLLLKELVDMRKAEERRTNNDEAFKAEIEALEAEAAELEKENDHLKKLQKELARRAIDGADLGKKVKELKREVDQKGEIVKKTTHDLEALEKATKKVLIEHNKEVAKLKEQMNSETERVTSVEREAEAFLAERNDLYFDMAALCIKGKMYAKAEKELFRLLKIEGLKSDVHYNLGILYDHYLNDDKKAVKHYEEFLKLDPGSADAPAVRVWVAEAKTTF